MKELNFKYWSQQNNTLMGQEQKKCPTSVLVYNLQEDGASRQFESDSKFLAVIWHLLACEYTLVQLIEPVSPECIA